MSLKIDNLSKIPSFSQRKPFAHRRRSFLLSKKPYVRNQQKPFVARVNSFVSTAPPFLEDVNNPSAMQFIPLEKQSGANNSVGLTPISKQNPPPPPPPKATTPIENITMTNTDIDNPNGRKNAYYVSVPSLPPPPPPSHFPPFRQKPKLSYMPPIPSLTLNSINTTQYETSADSESAFAPASLKRKTHLPIPKPKRKKKEMHQDVWNCFVHIMQEVPLDSYKGCAYEIKQFEAQGFKSKDDIRNRILLKFHNGWCNGQATNSYLLKMYNYTVGCFESKQAPQQCSNPDFFYEARQSLFSGDRELQIIYENLRANGVESRLLHVASLDYFLKSKERNERSQKVGTKLPQILDRIYDKCRKHDLLPYKIIVECPPVNENEFPQSPHTNWGMILGKTPEGQTYAACRSCSYAPITHQIKNNNVFKVRPNQRPLLGRDITKKEGILHFAHVLENHEKSKLHIWSWMRYCVLTKKKKPNRCLRHNMIVEKFLEGELDPNHNEYEDFYGGTGKQYIKLKLEKKKKSADRGKKSNEKPKKTNSSGNQKSVTGKRKYKKRKTYGKKEKSSFGGDDDDYVPKNYKRKSPKIKKERKKKKETLLVSGTLHRSIKASPEAKITCVSTPPATPFPRAVVKSYKPNPLSSGHIPPHLPIVTRRNGVSPLPSSEPVKKKSILRKNKPDSNNSKSQIYRKKPTLDVWRKFRTLAQKEVIRRDVDCKIFYNNFVEGSHNNHLSWFKEAYVTHGPVPPLMRKLYILAGGPKVNSLIPYNNQVSEGALALCNASSDVAEIRIKEPPVSEKIKIAKNPPIPPYHEEVVVTKKKERPKRNVRSTKRYLSDEEQDYGFKDYETFDPKKQSFNEVKAEVDKEKQTRKEKMLQKPVQIELKKVIGRRRMKRSMNFEYLVQWRHHDKETWELERNLSNYPVFHEYRKRIGSWNIMKTGAGLTPSTSPSRSSSNEYYPREVEEKDRERPQDFHPLMNEKIPLTISSLNSHKIQLRTKSGAIWYVHSTTPIQLTQARPPRKKFKHTQPHRPKPKIEDIRQAVHKIIADSNPTNTEKRNNSAVETVGSPNWGNYEVTIDPSSFFETAAAVAQIETVEKKPIYNSTQQIQIYSYIEKTIAKCKPNKKVLSPKEFEGMVRQKIIKQLQELTEAKKKG